MRKKRKCIIEGCEAQQLARGWCRRHYNEWYRSGDIDTEREKHKHYSKRVNELDRRKSLEQELQETRAIYDAVIGTKNRLNWRRKLLELELEASEAGLCT